MSIDERLREFIWERCEADDLKTDEILREIKKVIAGELRAVEKKSKCPWSHICLRLVKSKLGA